MSRRRSRQPSISLFSFQDIVTSVTAILILIVLILSLELISRKYQEVATDGAATTAGVAEAVKALEEIERRLSALADGSSAPDVPAVPSDVAVRDIRIVEDQVERASEQLETAKRVNTEAQKRAEAAAAELAHVQQQVDALGDQERATGTLEEETRELNTANASERERLNAQQSEADKRTRGGGDLVFNRPRNDERRTWLLEVSDQGYAALQLGAQQATSLGHDSGEHSAFALWVAGLSPIADTVLILTRPSGVEQSTAAEQRLADRRIPHGIDLIGESQSVHDGTRGGEKDGHSPDPEKGTP